ncbi:MAG: molybdenum hydroxylase [Anaerolinea sp.]|nr:molybdenum hydroxylase [Anaerolinea sp.]
MNVNEVDVPTIMIRGGGDLASGVALRLYRAGFQIVITELPAPIMVRRRVSFAQAVFDGFCQVEEVVGKLASSSVEASRFMKDGNVAILVDPKSETSLDFVLSGLVDGRMTKAVSDQQINAAPCVIGLGPGFTAGENCHAVVETKRGQNLGRVYWEGCAEPDNGIPEVVNGFGVERVLYAPKDGILSVNTQIGDLVEAGALIASVDEEPVFSRFKGVIRGLIQGGLVVESGMKISDLDPRCDISSCYLVSDKALAVGSGVMEAILTVLPNR